MYSNTKPTTLYLPSTPLNFIVSCARALALQDTEQADLCFIDQSSCQNIYMDALKQWADTPFRQAHLLTASTPNSTKKAHRHALFQHIKELLLQCPPDQIATGSDRRIEFQFAHHFCSQQGRSPKGLYLDDGYYTYAGAYRAKHAYISNALIKKCLYGNWWEEPITVGGSSKISDAWLFSPHNAVADLCAHKHSLRPDWFASLPMRTMATHIIHNSGIQRNSLNATQVLFFLPHPNHLRKHPTLPNQIRRFIQQYTSTNSIAVKYHPRFDKHDSLELESLNTMILPTAIASEMLLLLLNPSTHLISFTGTVGLTAHWLRPDIKNTVIALNNLPNRAIFNRLMSTFNIPYLNQLSDVTL